MSAYAQAVVDVAYTVHGLAATLAGQAVTLVRELAAAFEPAGVEPGVRANAVAFRVRTAQVPTRPPRGATLVAAGVTYTVDGADAISQWEWRIYARA